MGVGTAFTTGMAGYWLGTVINKQETFDARTMLLKGASNAVSGILSVCSGFIGGVSGLRIDLASKLLARGSDIIARLFIENVFPGSVKLWGALRGGLK